MVTLIGTLQVIAVIVANKWATSAGRREDWARQDLVAQRASEVAEQTAKTAALLLTTQTAESGARTEVARLAKAANEMTQASLEKIHKLVNSDMTSARTKERDAKKALLASLHEQAAVLQKHGEAVSERISLAIVETEEQIQELDVVLADRLAAQHRVDAQVEKEKET